MNMLLLGLLLLAQDIQESATLRGHAGKALCASFSADGKYLVTGGEDKTVKIWDVATGKLVRAISGHRGFVNCAALSSDGQVVAASVGERSARLFKVETGEEITIDTMSFTGDGHYLVYARGPAQFEVYNFDAAEVSALEIKVWSIK